MIDTSSSEGIPQKKPYLNVYVSNVVDENEVDLTVVLRAQNGEVIPPTRKRYVKSIGCVREYYHLIPDVYNVATYKRHNEDITFYVYSMIVLDDPISTVLDTEDVELVPISSYDSAHQWSIQCSPRLKNVLQSLKENSMWTYISDIVQRLPPNAKP